MGAYNNALFWGGSNSIDCGVMMTYKAIIEKWHLIVDAESKDNGLEPSLVYAVIMQESSGLEQAKSPCGCIGLMQIMPTAALVDYNVKHRTKIVGEELYIPSVNVMVGTWYLAWLIQRLGGVFDALRAYNVGIGTVKKGKTLFGSDGTKYAKSVLDHEQQFILLLSPEST